MEMLHPGGHANCHPVRYDDMMCPSISAQKDLEHQSVAAGKKRGKKNQKEIRRKKMMEKAIIISGFCDRFCTWASRQSRETSELSSSACQLWYSDVSSSQLYWLRLFRTSLNVFWMSVFDQLWQTERQTRVPVMLLKKTANFSIKW